MTNTAYATWHSRLIKARDGKRRCALMWRRTGHELWLVKAKTYAELQKLCLAFLVPKTPNPFICN